MSQAPHASSSVIIDTSDSPHATLSPVALSSVTVTQGFWASIQTRNREQTLPTQYQHLQSTGHFENFRRAAEGGAGAFSGRCASDSDVYKWLEAASWTLADPSLTKNPANDALRAMIRSVTDLIIAAQEPDGYLNTCITLDRTGERWKDLRDNHELYCAGHLIQAAIAHFRATGEVRLLLTARRFANLICETFGSEPGQRPGVPGHPNIEMALIELARTTGDPRYLQQAAYFVNARGQGLIDGQAYHLDLAPFRDLDRLTGHAVRAGYLAAGATDLYAETGTPELLTALTRVWTHMRTRQMYITGGLGSRYRHEAIGADYELPNARAYAETCAAIATVMWAWRMLHLHGDSQYADIIERTLYNAILPGVSLDGKDYFYANPLASDGVPEPGAEPHQRRPWFDCACCPPNLARTIAMVPGMLYSTTENTIWVHHYATSEADIQLSEARSVKLLQRTRYPWDGQVIIETLTPGNYNVRVRIPAWCSDRKERDRPTVVINGGMYPGDVKPGQYVEIARTWAVGDTICIQLPMPIRRSAAHPHMLENTGRVALMRGPLLYCLEAVDHPHTSDLRDIVLSRHTRLVSRYDPELLGGIQIIQGQATVVPISDIWTQEPYRDVPPAVDSSPSELSITAIPYFAWANRELGAMQVWLRQKA